MRTLTPSDATIHVVDDDAAVVRSLERLLEAAGYRVASSGAVDFIEKPYSDDALLGAVETALSRATRADHDH
jgi:FixJ family two-component response regulator